MTNPFESIAAGLPKPEDLDREREVGASQALAREQTPDQAAAGIRGATAEPVWSDIAQDLPVTQELLADPIRAAAVQDDVENLSTWEKLFKGAGDTFGGGLGDAAYRGSIQDRVSLIGYRQSIGEATPEEVAEADRLELLATGAPRPQGLGLVPRGFHAAVESAPMMIGSAVEAGPWAVGGAVVGGVIGGIGGAAVTGGAGAAPGALGGAKFGASTAGRIGMTVAIGKREAGAAYREYIQIPGVTHEQAATASWFVGAANGALEVLPIDYVLQIPGIKAAFRAGGTRDVFRVLLRSSTGRAALVRAAGRLAGGITLNALQEAAQELSVELGKQALPSIGSGTELTGGTDEPVREVARTPLRFDLGKVDWGRVREAGIEGGLAAGVMGAPGLALGTRADFAEAARAKERAAWFTSLGEAASESKTIQRLPDLAKAQIEAIQERHGGPVEAVTAPAEALLTLFQTNEITLDQMARRMPAVARQLEEAAGNPGVEISIPTADFAVNVAPLKGYEQLVLDLRVGDEMTLREAQEVEAKAKELAAAEKKAEGKAAKVEPAPEQRVVQDVAAKLEAVGQAEDTARTTGALWGAFARTMAARTGAKDAWAFYEGIGLQVEHADFEQASVDMGPEAADVLTGARNQGAWLKFQKRRVPGFYLAIDVNDLKRVNDTLGGHEAGNEYLRAVAGAVGPAIQGQRGKFFRSGGDEFVGHFQTAEEAQAAAAAVQTAMAALPRMFGDQFRASISVGLGRSPDIADAASMKAKGRARAAGRSGFGRPGAVTTQDLAQGDTFLEQDLSEPMLQELEQPPTKPGAQPRGSVTFPASREWFKVTLTGSANLSTFLHESGHVFLEVLRASAQKSPDLQADLETLQGWLGVPITGEWTPDQLERFAKGFETYLREGTAPSSSLTEVFQAFKAWLGFVYRSIRGLGVELTDEVRGVMDRMLATQAEVAEARRNAALLPIESAELAGMSEAEYQAYRERFEKGAAAAQSEVEQRALAALAGTVGEERAGVLADVEQLAREEQVFNLREFLRTGKRLDGAEVDEAVAGAKLDREALEGLADQREMRRLQFFTGPEGFDPDVLAPYFGYPDGHTMIRALIETPRRESWIRSEVTRRMAEKYSDSTIASLAKQAVEAVQDQEGFVRALRAELDATGRKVGAPPSRSAVEVLRQAAKARVAEMTDTELRPDRYRRASVKASKEFLEHLVAKRFAEAHDAKRRQLWNHFMTRETEKAKTEVEKIRSYLRGLEDVAVRRRLGKAGQRYLDAMDALLDGIELRRQSLRAVKRKQSLARYIQEMEAEGDVVAPALKDLAELKSYREMTLQELRGVEAAAANLEAMARLKGKLLIRGEKRDLARTAAELADRIRERLGRTKGPTPGLKPAGETARSWLRRGDASMKKIEFLVRELDGGETAGPAHQVIFQPLVDAQNARYDLQDKVYGALLQPFKDLDRERRRRYAQKIGFLYSPKFGKMVRLTRRDVLSVVLNLGNDGNRERLLAGYGWTEEQVRARLGQLLDQADVAIVEHVWKTVDSLWPAIRDLHQRHAGTAPRRVEATPFALVLADGTEAKLSGGYYPISKAIDLSDVGRNVAEAAEAASLWTANFFAPVVEHGFTESRGNDMSALDLSLDVVPRHLDKVIHYLTHYEAIRGVDKLLQVPDLRNAITEGVGREYLNEFRPWLEAIAGDGTVTDPIAWWSKLLRHLRFGFTVTALFGKIPTGLKQGLGLFTSAKEVKRRHLVSGLRQFMRNGWTKVLEESGEFRHVDKQLDRDARELFVSLQGRFGASGRARIIEWGALPIMLVQKAVNAITWYAAREQAMEQGHTDPNAYADSIVRITQTGGGVKDLAAIQRGGEAFKMLTVMFSYRSVLYNLLAEKTGKTGMAKTKAVFARVWWALLMPVVAEQLIMNGVADDEDAEDVAKRLSIEFALLPMSTVPVLGDVAEAGLEGRRMSAAPWLETLGRSAMSTKDILEGEGDIRDAKQMAELVGVVMHLPTVGLWNVGDFGIRLVQGELDEPVQDLLFRNPSKWE